MTITERINREIRLGDKVFSVPGNDHGCLIGIVTGITPRGSPGYNFDNKSEDIIIDFKELYKDRISNERKEEIAGEFSKLQGKLLSYDELPLSDVIISRENLIQISGLDNWSINKIASSRADAENFYNNNFSAGCRELEIELFERMGNNFSEYFGSIRNLEKEELITMSGRISSMIGAYEFITAMHEFERSELEFFLKFQNPLEIIGDTWYNQNEDLYGLHSGMEYINDNRDSILNKYLLMTNHRKDEQKVKPKTFEEKLNEAKDKVKAQNKTSYYNSQIPTER